MKKVVIVCVGSSGDVLPMFPLGIALQKLGCHITLVYSEDVREMADAAGFQLVCRDGKSAKASHRDTADGLDYWTTGCVKEWIIDSVAPFKQVFDRLVAACRGADLLIDTSIDLCTRLVAAKLNLPRISVAFSPMSDWRPGPPLLIRLAEAALAGHDLTASSAARQLIDELGADAFESAEHLVEGLSRLDRFLRDEMMTRPIFKSFAEWAAGEGLYDVLSRPGFRLMGNDKAIYAAPAEFCRPDAEYSTKTITSGFWFYDDPGKGRNAEVLPDGDDAALSAFLARRPAVLTMGSMIVSNPAGFLRRHVEAARSLGWPLLVQRGWTGFGPDMLPPELADSDDLHFVDFISHDRLFESCRMVIHHGGIGTIGRCLRHGRAMLVEPVCCDQAFTNWQVVRNGLGASVHPYDTPASALAEVMAAVASDPVIEARCTAWKHKIATTDALGPILTLARAVLESGTAPEMGATPEDGRCGAELPMPAPIPKAFSAEDLEILSLARSMVRYKPFGPIAARFLKPEVAAVCRTVG